MIESSRLFLHLLELIQFSDACWHTPHQLRVRQRSVLIDRISPITYIQCYVTTITIAKEK